MPTTLMELDAERRDAVLNAALGEFASRGYANASTNVIAREAGISKALMFHYVGSKRELFLSVDWFFRDLLRREYVEKMNLADRDVIARLRQSFLLQITLAAQYPSILALEALFEPTGDADLDHELERRRVAGGPVSVPLFDGVDEERFRLEMAEGVGMRLVRWAAEGFAAHLLEAARRASGLDAAGLAAEVEGFADDLRRALYQGAGDLS